ncbi:hypothetical protein LCGC14_2271350, partial [marine sediment metagenome]
MDLKNKGIVINFEPISRRVLLTNDNNIYDLLSDIRIPIRSICGGQGTCGKCRLLIQTGKEFLITPTSSEKIFLNPNDLDDGWRLGCQTKIDINKLQIIEKTQAPQLRIFLPNELILEDFKILTSGINKGVTIQPAVKKYYLNLEKPTLTDPLPDFERLVRSLISVDRSLKVKVKKNIEFALLNKLPGLLRESNYNVTITLLNNNKIIAVEPGNTVKNNYGIAYDIGTTTIVGYLINLNNGKVYAINSRLNSQTAYGEDVVTRITYIKDDAQKLVTLRSAVLNDLNKILINTCTEVNIDPSQI